MRWSKDPKKRAAQFLRQAACEWAAHLHDEPEDYEDSAGRRRWYRLAQAAYEFARANRAVPGLRGE